MAQRLSEADVEAIAARAAELVLGSDELRELVAEETRVQAKRAGRRAASASSVAARARKRAEQRREQAQGQAQRRQQEESERAERLLAMWKDGVPRAQIARELGFTAPGFQAEIYRLRDEGHDLSFRPGVD